MGSIITRTFGHRERRARLPSTNEQELKQVIKVMCSFLLSLPLFSIGFMTTAEDSSFGHILEYIIIGMVCSLLMNISNPSSVLAVGWLIVMIRSLFINLHASFFYNMGCYLTVFAIIVKLYDYFTPLSSHPKQIKYVIPSVLFLVISFIIKLGYCSSQYMKTEKIDINGGKISNHAFGIRLLLSILGLMAILMTLLGHIYIRVRRFIPLSFTHQFYLLTSFKKSNYLKIILNIVALRGFLSSIQQVNMCLSGKSLMINFFISVFVLAFVALIITNRVFTGQYSTRSKISFSIFTMILFVIYLINHYLDFYSQANFYLSLSLCLLLIIQTCNQIKDEMRINYILSLLVAIMFEVGPHKPLSNEISQFTTILGWICLLISVILQLIQSIIKSKANTYRHIVNSQRECVQIVIPY